MKINRFWRSRARTAQFESLEPRTLLTVGNNLAVGDELRTYRLAVSATAEFTEQAGGQAAAYQAIQTLVEKVNDFYEVEAALHFDLVSGTNLVFTNTQTDGFSNSTAIGSTDLSTLGQQNKTQTDRLLGAANYDVGIVLGYEGNLYL